MDNHELLIYNWNEVSKEFHNIELSDETLRDGLQACGIIMPTKEQKYMILEKMCNLPISSACIGFPASSKMIFEDVDYLISSIVKNNIKIHISCCARCNINDITPIINLSQKYGIAIEANIFIASSSIRHLVENWDTKDLIKIISKSVKYSVKNNLKVCFITEDTTRSSIANLNLLYGSAINEGAHRICLCDTVGFVDCSGVMKLVQYVKETILKNNQQVKIDWHGHNDLGLALSNSLTAIRAGVNRIHATGLGIGERSGNTSMEQLIANIFSCQRFKSINPIKIKEYCNTIAKYFHYKIPKNAPVVGDNAFSTGSGIHTSAIIKAQKRQNEWLIHNMFSSLPANEFGYKQTFEINNQVGVSAIKYFLEENNIFNDSLMSIILEYAKSKRSALTINDINKLLSKQSNDIAFCNIVNPGALRKCKNQNINIKYQM